jgi:hypothetical protein
MIIMKKSLFVFLSTIFCLLVNAQINETLNSRAEQLEMMTEKKDAEPADDSYELDLDYFSRHP